MIPACGVHRHDCFYFKGGKCVSGLCCYSSCLASDGRGSLIPFVHGRQTRTPKRYWCSRNNKSCVVAGVA